MKIAIPTFGNRVSPRFDCAQSILVITVDDGRIAERQELSVGDWTQRERVKRLLELGVDTVICGGLDRWSFGALRSAGAIVYCWVAGEVEPSLAALLRGELDAAPAMETRAGCRCQRVPGDNGTCEKSRGNGNGNGRGRQGRHGNRQRTPPGQG